MTTAHDCGSILLRPARTDDIDAYLALAQATGGGFTTLPADRELLHQRLHLTTVDFDKAVAAPGGENYIFVLEDQRSKAIIGTSAIYSQLGVDWSFYSFRLTRCGRRSPALDHMIDWEMLNLTTDFNGATEVGGLFLPPKYRGSGLGRLLARARYLFMVTEPNRVADRIVAELRGWVNEAGESPFWDALGRRMFDMPFLEADRFGAVNGNQFIADLMPPLPVITNLLPEEARAVIGRPHREGEGALALLIREGFRYEGYVDIFDAGPTVHARMEDLAAVTRSRRQRVKAIRPLTDSQTSNAIVAAGLGREFRCCVAPLTTMSNDASAIDPATATLLNIGIDDTLYWTPFDV